MYILYYTGCTECLSCTPDSVFGDNYHQIIFDCFSYRHQGNPHAETISRRILARRWIDVAVSLSGNLLTLYMNCRAVYSRIIPLPDYCANDFSSIMVTVADSTERLHDQFSEGIYVSRL